MFRRAAVYLQQNFFTILPGAVALCSLVLFIWLPVPLEAEESWLQAVCASGASGNIGTAVAAGGDFLYKPVAGVWFAMLALLPFGLNEVWLLRLLEAFSAMIMLYSVMYLGKSCFDRQTGIAAGLLTVSTYAFLLLGRTAGTDMFICSAIMITIVWADMRSRKSGFFDYFIFYIICLFCVLTKGVPFVVVPLLTAAGLLYSKNELRNHLNIKNFAAFLASAGVFILFSAFLFSVQEREGEAGWSLWGRELYRDYFYLLWQNNDHSKPWYFYGKEFLRLSFPWTPVVAVAIFSLCRDFRKACGAVRVFFYLACLFFCIFSAVANKEWYYMACIVPFWLLLTAQWLCRSGKSRWEEILIDVLYYFVIIVSSVAILSVCILPVMAARTAVALPVMLIAAPFVAGAIVVAVAIFAESETVGCWMRKNSGIPERLIVTLFGMAVLMCVLVSCCMPALDFFRSTQMFVQQELMPVADKLPASNIVLLSKQPRGDIIYYLNRKEVIPHFSVWDKSGEVDGDLFMIFADYINRRSSGDILIISDDESMVELVAFAGAIPGWNISMPDWREPENKSADANKHNRKIIAWILQ